MLPILFEFGSYQLDPAVVRLFKKGREIEIEPLVFNTLLLLIEKRVRVVTKDELVQEIWNGRLVTDNVITRTVYEIRKLIDFDDKQSMIRTVRGKGYQFIAEVIESENRSDSFVEPNLTEKPQSKLQLYLWLMAISVLVLLLIGSILIKRSTEQSDSANASTTEPSQNVYPIVTVLPIGVNASNEELTILVQSLIDYLTDQLALNLNMKVIHPDSLVTMSDQLDDIWAIQKATRSDFIIQGFIESVTDQSINLHLSLFKNNGEGVLTPFSLGAFEFTYPKNTKELKDLYKQSKVTVRSIVSIIKPGMIVDDNGHAETDDPEAYRLVITAHHISRTDDCIGMQRAEQLLLKAIERDNEFVYAYRQLFKNYYKRVWICGESIEYHQKGLAMAEMVDRLAPNSFHAMAMRRSTIFVESNQVEKAYVFSKDADWNNPNTIYDKSYSLRYAGFLNAASQNLNRILQLDPFFFNAKPIQHAPNTLLYQNRFKEHLALLAEPGNSYHDYFRGLNLFLTDNIDQAIIILNGVVARTPTDLFGKFSQALLYIIKNDYSGAVQVIDSIAQQRNKKKHTDGEMTYKLVQLYALANDQKLALKNLQISVDQGFFPMNYFLMDPTLKSIQNTEQFSAIVEQASKRHEAFAERFGLEPETVVGSTLK